jgi:hypothetical protein
MNQNVNCVEEFIRSPHAADDFLLGMAESALNLNIPLQWCYASPNEVFSSLNMPSVTNFRVSFDFCYGKSYDIGTSSLLVWALGAVPSKDTLWSTDNNRTETPGCSWTPDHENAAAELHVVLALMSKGPFGLSDGIGMTNATLIRRVIANDGTLLQPAKPITAVDSTFLEKSPHGYLYGTYGMGPSWIFVSFQLQDAFPVTLRDFWPNLPISPLQTLLAYRTFSDSLCRPGEDAVASGCVTMIPVDSCNDHDKTIFMAPPASFVLPGSDLAPNVVTVWQSCPESGVFFMGELDKYVTLSPRRFQRLHCTKDGLSVVVVRGEVGEVIEVTYLVPQTRNSEEIWYKVLKKRVELSSGNSTLIVISYRANDGRK